jgi:hypothetical protein
VGARFSVVDKVALGQVFLRVVGFPLSISFHWCSINCKNLVKNFSSIYHHHWGCTKSLKAVVRGPFIQQKKKKKKKKVPLRPPQIPRGLPWDRFLFLAPRSEQLWGPSSFLTTGYLQLQPNGRIGTGTWS